VTTPTKKPRTSTAELRERIVSLEESLEEAEQERCDDTDPSVLGVAARQVLAEDLPAFAALGWVDQDRVTARVVAAIMEAHGGTV
jgi:hypothetical protein